MKSKKQSIVRLTGRLLVQTSRLSWSGYYKSLTAIFGTTTVLADIIRDVNIIYRIIGVSILLVPILIGSILHRSDYYAELIAEYGYCKILSSESLREEIMSLCEGGLREEDIRQLVRDEMEEEVFRRTDITQRLYQKLKTDIPIQSNEPR